MSPHHHARWTPERDIPSLQGKVILITGGNIGLGKQSALELAKHDPAEIWIAARNAQTSAAAIKEIQNQAPHVSFKFLELDLSSLASVQKAAQLFTSSVTRLDILFCNAGVMGRPPGLTTDGYEVQFGTNHLGHACLLELLTPLLLSTASLPGPRADVRVVFVSSVAHKFTTSDGINFDLLKTKAENIQTNDRYGQSKLANLLYAQEAARRHKELTIVSIHPGTVKTGLQKSNDGSLLLRVFQSVVVPLVGVPVEEGAKNQLWAATAPKVVSGEYYEPIGVPGRASNHGKDRHLATKLWDWTHEELKRYIS